MPDVWEADVTVTEILAHLRAVPLDAYLVASHIRVAGPWTRRGSWWMRPNPTSNGGGGFGHIGVPATRRAFEDADAQLRAEGWLLVGGIPDDVLPECGEVHEMTQGRPRLPLPSDPRRKLACMEPAGHPCACRALAPPQWLKSDRASPEDRSRPLVWWSAGNAMERR